MVIIDHTTEDFVNSYSIFGSHYPFHCAIFLACHFFPIRITFERHQGLPGVNVWCVLRLRLYPWSVLGADSNGQAHTLACFAADSTPLLNYLHIHKYFLAHMCNILATFYLWSCMGTQILQFLCTLLIIHLRQHTITNLDVLWLPCRVFYLKCLVRSFLVLQRIRPI